MKKGKIIIPIIIIAVILTGVMIKNFRKDKPIIVKTTEVVRGDIQTLLSTNAMIQSKKIKEYIGHSQYTVDKVLVEVGQNVKKGDVLLTYDLFELETSVKQAHIQLENAILGKEDLLKKKADIEQEITELDQEIFALDGSSDPKDISNLQSLIIKRESMQTISEEQIMQAEHSIDLARLSLELAQKRLDEVKDGIVSEFDGTVTFVNAKEGSLLGMGQPAFIVQQLNNLKGVLYLGKYDAQKIRLGQKAFIVGGDKEYQGVVSFIDPAATKIAGMSGTEAVLKAEIDIKNPDTHLKVDFDAEADILTGEAKGVLTLPLECVKFGRNGEIHVFVIEGNIAKLTPIKTGLQSETNIEIIEGLKEGDIVISNPSDEVKDGIAVIKEGIQ
jgi:HlyD family secretion protein